MLQKRSEQRTNGVILEDGLINGREIRMFEEACSLSCRRFLLLLHEDRFLWGLQFSHRNKASKDSSPHNVSPSMLLLQDDRSNEIVRPVLIAVRVGGLQRLQYRV